MQLNNDREIIVVTFQLRVASHLSNITSATSVGIVRVVHYIRRKIMELTGCRRPASLKEMTFSSIKAQIVLFHSIRIQKG